LCLAGGGFLGYNKIINKYIIRGEFALKIRKLFCLAALILFLCSCARQTSGRDKVIFENSNPTSDYSLSGDEYLRKYIEPCLGITAIEHFDKTHLPSGDEMAAFYYYSEAPDKPEVNVSELENFVQKYFEIDKETLRASSFYDSEKNIYFMAIQPGAAMGLSLDDIEITPEGKRIVFIYTEEAKQAGVRVVCRYEAEIKDLGGDFKFVAGRNIETKYEAI
jgi:hypothetical protein